MGVVSRVFCSERSENGFGQSVVSQWIAGRSHREKSSSRRRHSAWKRDSSLRSGRPWVFPNLVIIVRHPCAGASGCCSRLVSLGVPTLCEFLNGSNSPFGVSSSFLVSPLSASCLTSRIGIGKSPGRFLIFFFSLQSEVFLGRFLLVLNVTFLLVLEPHALPRARRRRKTVSDASACLPATAR